MKEVMREGKRKCKRKRDSYNLESIECNRHDRERSQEK